MCEAKKASTAPSAALRVASAWNQMLCRAWMTERVHDVAAELQKDDCSGFSTWLSFVACCSKIGTVSLPLRPSKGASTLSCRLKSESAFEPVTSPRQMPTKLTYCVCWCAVHSSICIEYLRGGCMVVTKRPQGGYAVTHGAVLRAHFDLHAVPRESWRLQSGRQGAVTHGTVHGCSTS